MNRGNDTDIVQYFRSEKIPKQWLWSNILIVTQTYWKFYYSPPSYLKFLIHILEISYSRSGALNASDECTLAWNRYETLPSCNREPHPSHKSNPAGMIRWNNIESMLKQCQLVVLTLIKCCINVRCLQGSVPLRIIKPLTWLSAHPTTCVTHTHYTHNAKYSHMSKMLSKQFNWHYTHFTSSQG